MEQNLLEGVRPLTVVVTEDEPVLRMIAVEFLTDAGFQVIEAAHAKDALSILESQAHKINVLFTDIRMPGAMSGLELASYVRSTWPNIKVLITSGEAWPKTVELPQGSRFFRKPYVHEEVIDQVRTVNRV